MKKIFIIGKYLSVNLIFFLSSVQLSKKYHHYKPKIQIFSEIYGKNHLKPDLKYFKIA